jgi:hypothetical protein
VVVVSVVTLSVPREVVAVTERFWVVIEEAVRVELTVPLLIVIVEAKLERLEKLRHERDCVV